uniref:Uncharacterized protein n=1 Tax=Glossina palpalis gambiensis TaxID=67801 RepID=A0A1B0C776_9MUSC
MRHSRNIRAATYLSDSTMTLIVNGRCRLDATRSRLRQIFAALVFSHYLIQKIIKSYPMIFRPVFLRSSTSQASAASCR